MGLSSQTMDRAEALLLGAGRLHGITATKDEVRSALEDAEHGPAFAEWAMLHLGHDNLLTGDEMALYTALDRSGQVDKLAEFHDLADVQAVTEEEVRAAVEELNRSTSVVAKQAETLRQQQDALSRLVKRARERESARNDFERMRQHNSETERKFISAEVEDISHSLSFRLGDLEQQNTESGSSLNGIIDNVLSSDDKLLASLQKLGYELDQQDPDEAKTAEDLREICMRLIKTTVETIRTRLDRIYLETLVEAEHSRDTKTATEDEVRAMEEEVESLYSEILPVAQMSVEQQHLEPALQSISSCGGKSLERSAIANEYVNACLDHLIDRCDRLKSSVDSLRSHQVASTTLITTARAALAAPKEPPLQPQKVVEPMSPVRRGSPVRPRANTAKSRGARRSSGIADEPPIDALLQSLAVYITPETDADSGRKLRALADVVSERSRKGRDMARDAQESFEATAAAYLDDVRRAVQMVKDSLLAESPYSQIHLEDPEIRGSIDVLAHEVQKVKQGLENAEAKKLVGKSEKKEEMLQRWGA